MVVMHMVRMMSMNLTMLRYFDHAKVLKRKRGKAKPRKAKPKSDGLCSACGSSTHKRSTHRDCPFNTKRSTAKTSTKPVIVAVDSPSQSSDAVSDVHSISDAVSETGGIDSDDYMMCMICAHVVVVAGPTRGTAS